MTILNDFQFPEIFLEMNEQGWLDSRNFINFKNFESQKYLWLYDMEWLTCEKILHYQYEEYESRSIVPFAITGGGDKWAWYLEFKQKLPVVYCPHDDDEGLFYAENIEAAIFRQILEFVSQNNFFHEVGQSWEMSIFDAKRHLKNWRTRFKKWFKKEWNDELDKLITLDLKYYSHNSGGYYVLITPEEAKEKIERYLNFNLLNKSFIWTNQD
ncbi:hypothetical protein V7150_09765 [Neobacillus drentensis]|uniref:hypothetical protein n=1 Tax=Neobacillus drentensis TaxID=220684 RepID=UPI002FFFAB6A